MSHRLPDELRQAIAASPDRPLRVQDDQTQKVYLLVEVGLLPTLWDEYVRREVQQGLAAADRGEVEPWDTQSIKAEGRRQLQERSE